MSNNYKFVPTDTTATVSQLIERYEEITGRTLQSGDPDRLFILWVADIIVQDRVYTNYTGNQNLPSRAISENLDELGTWIYDCKRQEAQPAICTMEFTISKTQDTAILIPQGTRVTDSKKTLTWYTTADALVAIGETTATIMAQCETSGTSGNGYAPGEINTLLDIDNIKYFSSCRNTDTSNSGAERATDEEYFEIMRSRLDAYSTAGPKGAYEYWAKSVSSEIADVCVIQPRQAITDTYPVYTNGSAKSCFIGGDYIDETSVVVYKQTGSVAALGVDYTLSYKNALLEVTIKSDGSLSALSSLKIKYVTSKAGYVNIFAIMDDGSIADDGTKAAILAACNDDNVRPLTDVVEVKDPDVIDYNIDLTYYINLNADKSLSDIQSAVTEAVSEYVAWQRGKIGRDINPSKLEWLLHDTGIKRVVITNPTFMQLKDGKDNYTPQVAKLKNLKITNGGYEDE